MNRRFSLAVVLVAVVGLLCSYSAADVPMEALVGAWLFDEGAGEIAKDASGNGHDGKILGPKRVQGKHKSALEFDGKDDIVEVPHHEAFDLVTYTALAWINVPKAGDLPQTVLGKDAPAGLPRNFGVFVGKDLLETFTVLGTNYTQGGQWKTARGTTVLTDGKWYHVAATYDGEFLRAYTDGEMQGETATAIPPDHNTDPVRFGRWGADRGDFIKGVIDEIAIFNKALTESEIKDVMAGLAIMLAVEPSGKLATTWSRLKTR